MLKSYLPADGWSMIIKQQNGFTLVESVMVIVLLMILSASAVSIFSGQKIFNERFLTDEVKQMLYYARKIAMTTECDVEIVHRDRTIKLRQRENCHSGDFTRYLPSNTLLDNATQYSIQIPTNIEFTGKFPVTINKTGTFYVDANKRPEKFAWHINRRVLHIDPISGFAYESK